MNGRTIDWMMSSASEAGSPLSGGLRERKKRLMRQQLSDTATQMFLERGFDAFRVAEVAEACDVSEKTVFNYFPTKESLILDRFDTTMDSLRTALSDPGLSPVEAMLQMLAEWLGGMTSLIAMQDDPIQASTSFARFDTLVEATPSLRAHRRDLLDQFIAVAAEILAERAGMSSDDPEPQIAANALLGLWQIQMHGLKKNLDGSRTPAEVREAVNVEVRRAALLLDTGLSSLVHVEQGFESRRADGGVADPANWPARSGVQA
jgi:AcrR family transcriptional regulator